LERSVDLVLWDAVVFDVDETNRLEVSIVEIHCVENVIKRGRTRIWG
jgi:hypothetical protein